MAGKFRPVSSQANFVAQEQETLQFWRERDVFRRSVSERAGGETFVFYEGPPTANGKPGIHHVLARVFKDIIPRYQTMRGRYVPRKGGWDTHGLPVELEVERQLGFSGKQQIEAYGVAEFNRQCRESVFRYVKEWERMTERIAFWIDMDDAYITYRNSYIESGWWIMRQLWDRKLIFQDYKVTPYCPRCGTSLSDHEVALGYKEDTEDPSVYVKFRLRDPLPDSLLAGHEELRALPTYFLAWTTTPWTLPGNAALALAPEATYVVAEHSDKAGKPELLILAQELANKVLGDHPWHVHARAEGATLAGLRYEPLYTFAPVERGKQAHRALTAGFVSLDDGTGIVHIAPAFGAEDLALGRAYDLPVIVSVDLRGNVVPGAPFSGKFVKQADPEIIADLDQRGLLLRVGTIRHTYPFCWRCDTPLLYYAKTSWYIRTTAVKDRLLANNDRINWYPEHIKWGRFGDWLRNNVDWALSRERYWGTPLPFWLCDAAGCDEKLCIGSVAELSERAGRDLGELDLHRPYVDEVTWACARSNCTGTMRRVPEVADAWYDSGAMPVAQWHYPFENQELFRERFPADFICEAIDQTRGWFYSLHAEATLLFDDLCYRNVICLGHLLDAKGEKMSKSKGNVVDPWDVLDRQGADALRWYLYTASPAGSSRRFSAELVQESLRQFLLTLWNCYSFFVLYANVDGFDPASHAPTLRQRPDLDRWILSELHTLVGKVTASLDAYDPTTGGRALEDFVDVLSNWYLRRSRRRFWKSEDDADKAAAYHTLYECLVTLSQLLAPFTPFVAETMYQNLVRSVDAAAPDSVHLCLWPEADARVVDSDLVSATRVVMRVVSLGRAARSKASLKVRQPLSKALVKTRTPEESEGLMRLGMQVLDELNVKELQPLADASGLLDYVIKPNLKLLGPKLGKDLGKVTAGLKQLDPAHVAYLIQEGQDVEVAGFSLMPEEVLVEAAGKPGYALVEEAGYVVALTTEVTPELAAEGLAREIAHRMQNLRKIAGLEVADRIATTYQGGPRLEAVMAEWADYIKAETLSLSLERGTPAEGASQETMRLDGQDLTVAIARAS